MKALVKKYPQKGLVLEDVAEPIIGNNDVLIKIKKTAICGTDLHIYNWDTWAQAHIPVPMHVGHEFIGEVIEVGSSVTGVKVGARVSGEGHVVCGFCRNCRAGTRHLCVNTKGIGVDLPGCFAEYLRLPATNVFPLPDNISDEEASILDPFGNAVHTALSFDVVGEDVLVTGAGPIGIMGAAVCNHIGARNVVITDVNDYRLELAKKLGLVHCVNTSKVSLKQVMADLGMHEGFDVGLEMSGNKQAFSGMLDSVKMGASIALLGILPSDAAIDWTKVIFKGLTVKGIYGRQMFETWYKMVALIQSGLDINPIITHRFNYRDYEKGFEAMNTGKSGKVILDWQS